MRMNGAKLTVNTSNGEGSRASCKKSPRSASRVSFSSEVSIYTEGYNDDATIATTEELAAAEHGDDVSPRSLFSGRWIEDIQESNETRGVAVVEVTDTSPMSNSFRGFSRKRMHTVNTKNTSSSSNTSPEEKLREIRKRLLERNERPLKSNGKHSIPALSTLDDAPSPLARREEKGNDNTSGDLSIDSTLSKTPVSPLSQTVDLDLLNTAIAEQNEQQTKLLHESDNQDWDIRPISRRGKMWARLVNVLRALFVFIAYTLVLAGEPLCGENSSKIVGIKLGGAFVLSCLASFVTRDQQRRTGWKKLSEIVCSRKTFLLLIYIAAWSYIVNAADGLWNSHPFGDTRGCTGMETERLVLPWEATTENKRPLLQSNLDDEKRAADIDDAEVMKGKTDINAVLSDILLVAELQTVPVVVDEPELIRLETEDDTLNVDESVPFLAKGEVDVDSTKSGTRPGIEPKEVDSVIDENVLTRRERDMDAFVSESSQLLEPQRATTLKDEMRVSYETSANMDTDYTEVMVGEVVVDDLTPETRQAMEPQIVPNYASETEALSIALEVDRAVMKSGGNTHADLNDETLQELPRLHSERKVHETDELSEQSESIHQESDEEDRALHIDHSLDAIPRDEINPENNSIDEPPDRRQELQQKQDGKLANRPEAAKVAGSKNRRLADIKVDDRETHQMGDEVSVDSVSNATESSSDSENRGQCTLASESSSVPKDSESSSGAPSIQTVETNGTTTATEWPFNESPATTPNFIKGPTALDSSLDGSVLPSNPRVHECRPGPTPLVRFRTPFLTKTRKLASVKDTSSLCSSCFEFQGSELSARKAQTTKDGNDVLLPGPNKAAMLAALLRRHLLSFLLGVDGRYKNQFMMDSLSEVWISPFWT